MRKSWWKIVCVVLLVYAIVGGLLLPVPRAAPAPGNHQEPVLPCLHVVCHDDPFHHFGCVQHQTPAHPQL